MLTIPMSNICDNSLPRVSNTRAACGPPYAFARPANVSKTDKIIKVDTILLMMRAFLVNCGPQKLFFNKQQPTEHFFFVMWPSYEYEFETPALYICFTSLILIVSKKVMGCFNFAIGQIEL
jgi:hypothetical protein